MPQKPFDEIANNLTAGIPEHIDQTMDLTKIEQAPEFGELLNWVVNNIAQDPDGLKLDKIPYPACKSLLQWSQTDPDKFWPWVAKYDQKREEANKTAKTFEDDKRKHFKLLDKVRNYFRERAEQQKQARPSHHADHA